MSLVPGPLSRAKDQGHLTKDQWRLAWHGREVEDVHFRTQREAQTAARDLMTLADFALPSPEAWAPAIQERVAAYVAALPCVVELERLRSERATGQR